MIAYWLLTGYVAVTSLGAGAMDLFRAQPLYGLLLHLGYPPHFATLLGLWKVLGAAVLLAPRLRLAKEWAYAGMFFDFSAALVAHAAAGDEVVRFLGPMLSMAALIGSWYLRPPSRRLLPA